MVYEGYSEGFINKLITGKARVVSDKNCGLLQPIYWDRSNDLKLPMVNVLLTFDDLGYPNFRKPPHLFGEIIPKFGIRRCRTIYVRCPTSTRTAETIPCAIVVFLDLVIISDYRDVTNGSFQTSRWYIYIYYALLVDG